MWVAEHFVYTIGQWAHPSHGRITVMEPRRVSGLESNLAGRGSTWSLIAARGRRNVTQSSSWFVSVSQLQLSYTRPASAVESCENTCGDECRCREWMKIITWVFEYYSPRMKGKNIRLVKIRLIQRDFTHPSFWRHNVSGIDFFSVSWTICWGEEKDRGRPGGL